MRSEFEKNRYWIGLFKTDVEFNALLGEFGRYELNGSRDVNHSYLEDFNSKWETYAKAWQHQQSKVDELQVKLSEDSRILHNVIDIERKKNDELQKRVDALETAFNQLIEMESESISTELDQFDKGWNQSARQTIENIFKLTGLGEQALKGGGE
jgi:hypothetical protein